MEGSKKRIVKKYLKEDIIQSKKFDVDILNVVLEDNAHYTLDEANKLVEKYKNKVVK